MRHFYAGQAELDYAGARASDPETSHAAAARARDFAGALGVKVYEELAKHGPGTTHELAERMGLSLVTVSPRMRPLELQGRVRRAGRRLGRTVWEAVAPS